MRSDLPASVDDKLLEGRPPEPGYEDWKRAKIERALQEMKDESSLVAAEQVWRDLGLET